MPPHLTQGATVKSTSIKSTTSKQPGIVELCIRYGFYPFWVIVLSGYAVFTLSGPEESIGKYHGWYLTALVSTMLLAEFRYPLRKAWRMTRASFFRRDFFYMVIGGVTMGMTQFASAEFILWFGLSKSEAHQSLSLVPSVLLILLITDFCWYWIHRFSHEGRGWLGQLMWRIHAAHHMPEQVYVFMHAVGHPLNFLVLRLIWSIPLFWMGFSVESLYLANLVIGLQGMFSHFNVDIRVGRLNYLLMGTETHRYHHSADPEEGKNYAATLSFWDYLFGTLCYKPGKLPDRLGLNHPEFYPRDTQLIQVLLLPFRSSVSEQAS